jgi:hypothetical protein
LIEAIGLFLTLSGWANVLGLMVGGGIVTIVVIVLWLVWLFKWND